MQQPVYLDYNATTPVDPAVLDAMLPWFTRQFGNASSATHAFGWQAAEAVEQAREQLAGAIGCTPHEIIFTSGATEAINLALKGAAEAYEQKGKRILVSATEHKAVLDTAEGLRRKGWKVDYAPVAASGRIDLTALDSAIQPDTVLVAVMLANNETGVIEDLPAVSRLVHAKGALLLSDIVQAVGKMPVKVDELGIDLAPVSAHKFYGPKGVGALFVRRKKPRVALSALLEGGGHERGLRSGTLNVPGIVGLGAAVVLAQSMIKAESERLGVLRDRLEQACLALGGVAVNGREAPRLPHVSNLAFEGLHARNVISLLPGLAVATGSACASASPAPSHVLRAMGFSDERIHGSLRFSLGRYTTEAEIDAAVHMIAQAKSRFTR